MKLPPLAIVCPSIVPGHCGALLSPSAPYSVCTPQKNQPHWLASSTSSSASLTSTALFLPANPLSPRLAPLQLLIQTPSNL